MNEIKDPILNNPFEEPTRYYETLSDGSLDYENIVNGRRPFYSENLPMPVRPNPQKVMFNANDLIDNIQDLLINKIRKEVKQWRNDNYPNITKVSTVLLKHWFDSTRTNKLFFAQREAIETAIWLNEVATKSNAGNFILEEISSGQKFGMDGNLALPRIAFKMATGTGKTTVIAMLIVYHFYNRKNYKNDNRFADYFLLLTPGVTIRDRHSVLIANEHKTNNFDRVDYYRKFDLVPQNFLQQLPEINTKLIITNRHNLEKRTLKKNKKTPFDGKFGNDRNNDLENFDIVINRVLSKFKKNRRLVVINDEAHHCYLPKAKGNRNEDNSEEENKRAAIWYNGILEISKRFKVSNVYDLSATPYYLNGSGYESGSFFPWLVSDFGLVEAMESGLVKIPFIPQSDDTHNIEEPVLRNLYEHVRDDLPKMGRNKEQFTGPPQLPTLVKNALDQFYSHYKKEYENYRGIFDSPPVFIIVCNNTNVSSEVFKYVAGYELNYVDEKKQIVNGVFELFDNFERNVTAPKLLKKPPTLLIDSDALENSEQISVEFKNVFKLEISEFKREYRIVHPEKSVDNITDAEILREVVNTVGKPGKLGAHIRCIVSVSMLTEGWDANTVTHIMGLRAFGSPLLCEQVVGRALRRVNYYTDNKSKKFPPEYAHVIGVPFSMFKGGSTLPPNPPQEVKIIKAIPERKEQYEITFPNVVGYRIENQNNIIKADFSKINDFELDATVFPTKTEMGNAIANNDYMISLEQVREKREQELIYHITKQLISLHFKDIEGTPLFYHFSELKKIVVEWLNSKVVCRGNAFNNMLFLWDERSYCHHIMLGINSENNKYQIVLPILNHYNKTGSTNYVFGKTTKEVYATKKSHINYVVADTKKWEQIAAKHFEEMPEVISYVKNHFLNFSIPYVKKDSEDANYFPDYILKIKTANGKIINLIVEISGFSNDKDDKKWYVLNRWIPAVNNIRELYEFEEWQFVEIADENSLKDIEKIIKEQINKSRS